VKITDKQRWTFIKKSHCTLMYLELHKKWICTSKEVWGVGNTPKDAIDVSLRLSIKKLNKGEVNDTFID